MACRWMRAPDGQWVVLIPEGEVLASPGGKGTYSVEQRDGTSRDVLVVRVSDQVRWMRGERVRCGVPERTQQDRVARVGGLSHVPADPHRVRLSKQRTEVVAPEAVLERHARNCEPLRVDGLKVWVEVGRDWRRWPVEGVRMVRAPIAAAMADA